MDITGLTPAMTALKYMGELLKDPTKFAELAITLIDPCDPSQPIEACIDDICHHKGEQVPRKIPNGKRDFLNKQVQGLMTNQTFLKLFGTPGAIMRAFLEGQNDDLCKPDKMTVMEKEAVATTAPAQKPVKKDAPAQFEINVTADDAARAGALTAGAKLVYDALMFGATVFPAARPATQGIMMWFGMTPTGFEYESPSDRMSREGA